MQQSRSQHRLVIWATIMICITLLIAIIPLSSMAQKLSSHDGHGNGNGGPNDGKQKKKSLLNSNFADDAASSATDTIAQSAFDAASVAPQLMAVNMPLPVDDITAAASDATTQAVSSAAAGAADMSSDAVASSTSAASVATSSDDGESESLASNAARMKRVHRPKPKTKPEKPAATAPSKKSGGRSSAVEDPRASITRAAARSGLVSVTRHALKYSPMLLDGDAKGYAKKVGTKAAYDAGKGAAFKALMIKYPIAKDVIVYGSLSYKVGSVCMEGTWTECGISAVTQVAKFGSYKWLGATGVLMITPNIWAGAVVYGVGQFLIDTVFDQVEYMFEPKTMHKL